MAKRTNIPYPQKSFVLSWCKDEGVWPVVVRERAEYKAQGETAHTALMVAWLFQGAPGCPPTQLREIVEAIKEIGSDLERQAIGNIQSIPTHDPVIDMRPAPPKVVESTAVKQPFFEVKGLQPKPTRGMRYMPESRDDDDDDAAPSGGLVSASVFAGKQTSASQTIDWVASHVAIRDVHPEEAPSATAWAMLQWVQRSPGNQAEFWRLIYPKRLPTSKAFEAEQQIIEDGRRLDELEDWVLRECEKATKQPEPAVSEDPA